MNRWIKFFYIAVVMTTLQACTNAGTPPQAPAVLDSNATGQNMDFMYRSPSYQLGHMGR